jgi:hypothetical protein
MDFESKELFKLFSADIFVQALVKWIFEGKDYEQNNLYNIKLSPDFLDPIKDTLPNTYKRIKSRFNDATWVAIHRYNENVKFSFSAERPSEKAGDLTALVNRVSFVVSKNLYIEIYRD